MGTLTSNTPLILALVAVATVVVNLASLFLQNRRDSSDYQTKRIEEAVKISAASSSMARDLVEPLRSELADVRKDQSATKALVKSQLEQIDRLQENYDEQHAELRATKADRDNLLAQRLIWQKKVEMALQDGDVFAKRIQQLEIEIAQLKEEIRRLKSEKEQGDFDPREFMSDE
jgi:chromosome segregation ATPase